MKRKLIVVALLTVIPLAILGTGTIFAAGADPLYKDFEPAMQIVSNDDADDPDVEVEIEVEEVEEPEPDDLDGEGGKNQGYYCANKDDYHPALNKLTNKYAGSVVVTPTAELSGTVVVSPSVTMTETMYTYVNEKFCSGYGVGEVKKVLEWSVEYGIDPEEIFALRESGLGYGQIKKMLADMADPTAAADLKKVPPGQLKDKGKPDKAEKSNNGKPKKNK